MIDPAKLKPEHVEAAIDYQSPLDAWLVTGADYALTNEECKEEVRVMIADYLNALLADDESLLRGFNAVDWHAILDGKASPAEAMTYAIRAVVQEGER